MKTRTLVMLGALMLAIVTSYVLYRLFLRADLGLGPAINAPAIKTPATQPAKTSDAAGAARPGVILISIDTVRPDHLGCYGYSKPTSPKLDAFALSGVRFANCRAQAPWTLPSHMALMTSMLPSHNRVENINQVLPAGITTLAQVLSAHGYRTVGLVNNGQMRAHWGFNRGFDTWREFEADTPEGSCPNVTNEAMKWLEKAATAPTSNTVGNDSPFFLFLHYYDAHDPYDPPEEFKKAFGSTLSGEQARQIVWDGRTPAQQVPPNQLEQVKASYDGEIAWLDRELGRLLPKAPPGTLVVIFSDHGEAFEEHGWTLHGGTLFDEEIRTVLLMGRVGILPGGEGSIAEAVVGEPVMLIDVAPTILEMCGIQSPPAFEGMSLVPALSGGKLADRAVVSETKSVLEGRVMKTVVLPPWKMVYSLLDGSRQLYKLPDEQTDLAAREKPVADRLFALVSSWVNEEDYWLLRANGSGEFEVSLEVAGGGQFPVFVPAPLEEDRDSIEPSEDGKRLRWMAYPGGKSKALYLQTSSPRAALKVDVKINGEAKPGQVFLGRTRTPADRLPVEVRFGEDDALPPMIEKPFEPGGPGLYIERHHGPGSSTMASTPGKLDAETIRQLRSLGYLQ